MDPRRKAALFLFLFSAISAELVTGSSPPLQFVLLSPLLFGFYGAGVLSVHEAAVRWRKGWPTVLLLGMAYGIVEEGLTNLTFFNPTWPGVVTYGRLAGVNWVWSVTLTIVHGIISISIPILVTQLVFPQFKWQPLLGRWLARPMPVFFGLIAVFQYFFIASITHFAPEPMPWFGALAAVIVLVLLGRRAPYHLFQRPPDLPCRRPLAFALVGFGFMVGVFLSEAFLGGLGAPAPAIIAVWIGLSLAATRWLEANLGGGGNEPHKLALVVGLQAMFVAFEVGLEVANPAARGLTVAGALYFAFLLVWVRRRILVRAATQGATGPGGAAVAMGSPLAAWGEGHGGESHGAVVGGHRDGGGADDQSDGGAGSGRWT